MKGGPIRKLRIAAATFLLLCTTSSVLAGSVTQPGDTMGSPSGAPILRGACRKSGELGLQLTRPRVPVYSPRSRSSPGQLPGKILGGNWPSPRRRQPGWTWTFTKRTRLPTFSIHLGREQLSWDLGHGWGFTYLLGAYFDVDSPVAYSSTSLNQQFGLSYIGNGWDLTANTIWGINFDQVNRDPQGFPCPTAPAFGCNNNFLNVDLTATKQFGKWELGPIGFYATDISTPVADYRRQSKAAIGGLVGYWAGPFILQIYGTTEFYEENYGGKDSRVWSRLAIPLGDQPARPIAQ